jgi:hypothetical protein
MCVSVGKNSDTNAPAILSIPGLNGARNQRLDRNRLPIGGNGRSPGAFVMISVPGGRSPKKLRGGTGNPCRAPAVRGWNVCRMQKIGLVRRMIYQGGGNRRALHLAERRGDSWKLQGSHGHWTGFAPASHPRAPPSPCPEGTEFTGLIWGRIERPSPHHAIERRTLQSQIDRQWVGGRLHARTCG